ncbi:MAG: 30S ribosome-binding factor RbfA [Phycisphaerales bacterium]|nr:30S ribosome-binding factor RbfA [Phycisphaerales bacterium]
MNRRMEKISASLLRAIQEVLARGLADPRIRGLITVTDVTVAPDLSEARVMVSVLPQSAQELTLHGLQAAAVHLRREVGELIDMRRMPQLLFRVDTRLKKEATVLDALNKVAQERQSHADQDAASAGHWSPPPPPDAGDPGGQQSASGEQQHDPRSGREPKRGRSTGQQKGHGA